MLFSAGSAGSLVTNDIGPACGWNVGLSTDTALCTSPQSPSLTVLHRVPGDLWLKDYFYIAQRTRNTSEA